MDGAKSQAKKETVQGGFLPTLSSVIYFLLSVSVIVIIIFFFNILLATSILLIVIHITIVPIIFLLLIIVFVFIVDIIVVVTIKLFPGRGVRVVQRIFFFAILFAVIHGKMVYIGIFESMVNQVLIPCPEYNPILQVQVRIIPKYLIEFF